MVVNPHPQQKQYAQMIARAWADEAFKTRLLREPAEVLKEYGIPLPEGVEVRMVENTDKVIHLVLPSEPPGEELTEEQLSQISAGVYLCLCTG